MVASSLPQCSLQSHTYCSLNKILCKCYKCLYRNHTYAFEKCFLPFGSFPKAHKFTNDALEQKLLHLNSRRCQAERNSLNPSHKILSSGFSNFHCNRSPYIHVVCWLNNSFLFFYMPQPYIPISECSC